MTVLVCGGRVYGDDAAVARVLASISPTRVVTGGASGADVLAEKWATAHGVPVVTFPADWSKYGRAAGPIRNARMLAESRPDVVVAFPGGKGTMDMVSRAIDAGVRVIDAMERLEA